MIYAMKISLTSLKYKRYMNAIYEILEIVKI